MIPPRKANRHLAATTAVILAAIGGCAGTPDSRPVSRVTPADFRDADAQPTTESPTIPVAPQTSPQDTPGVEVVVLTGSPRDASTPRTLTLGATDISPSQPSASPAPTPSDSMPSPEGGYLIDAYLGQVHGKPVYADEFLAPMDARLTAEANRLPEREWQRFAAAEIARSLRDLLQDELLLAEFRASLTPEERVGIGAFVDRIRQGLISESGGSREIARTRLLEAEGLTLNQKVDDEVKRAFIREQIRREIAESVSVTFRDIEVYYDLHPEEFAPAPVIRLRIIQAAADDQDKIDRIEAALRDGTPFREIAEAETTYNRVNAGEFERALDTTDRSQATIIGVAPLNEAARELELGEVSQRIEANEAVWWIKLEDLDAAQPKTLYEAQFDIEQKLREQRFSEAERRYFQRIVGRAGLADQEDIAIKLLEFASRRQRTQG